MPPVSDERLAELTDRTYLYACSMQTRQRKIPFTDGSAFGHWTQCLPEYEKEFAKVYDSSKAVTYNYDNLYSMDEVREAIKEYNIIANT